MKASGSDTVKSEYSKSRYDSETKRAFSKLATMHSRLFVTLMPSNTRMPRRIYDEAVAEARQAILSFLYGYGKAHDGVYSGTILSLDKAFTVKVTFATMQDWV